MIHLVFSINGLSITNQIRSVIPYPIIVICGSSLYWLLNEGFHRITIPPSVLLNEEKSWCGFASLNEPVIVSTSGLKWDVDISAVTYVTTTIKKVIFGEMISTSNTYCENSKGYVDIKCSKPLLWFMGWDQIFC
ncbi:thiamine pyrophosphokinase 1 [Armadillidium vulgare]|nr:thiamine pyrophosphokinase 1 [Armadillidium vulgare]